MSHSIIKFSKNNIANIFLKSPCPMLITNSKDGVIVDLNHAFTNFTGFKLKDIVGKSTLEMDYITLEERAKVVSEINVNGCSENNKKEIRDKNNKIKSIIFNTFPIAEDPDSLLITYLFDMSKARLRIELHNDVLFKVLTAITGVGIILIKDYEGTKSVFYENNEARQILKGNSIKNIFNVLIEKKVLYLNVKSELYCAKIFSIHNDSGLHPSSWTKYVRVVGRNQSPMKREKGSCHEAPKEFCC